MRKKDFVHCEGYIYKNGRNFVVGLPMDHEWFSVYEIEDENIANFIVENLRKKIKVEFLPQRLEVQYKYNKRGFLAKKEIYTIYVDAYIKF